MSVRVSQVLAEFFEDEVGDALRLVAHYDADTLDIIYLRDDLEDHYSESDFEQTFAIHRREKEEAIQQEAVIDAGKHHCTIRLFDEAIVFNFSQTDSMGTVVSLSPDVGRNLLAFVTTCLQEIDEHSPQDASAPRWAL